MVRDKDLHPIHPGEILREELLKTHPNHSLPSNCIHQDLAQRAIAHPQKMAIELDEQCLTYSELFFYVQQLATHLITNYHVKVGDIICQCVERSISMVSDFQTTILFISISCDLLGNWDNVNTNGWCCILSIVTKRSFRSIAEINRTNQQSSSFCSLNDTTSVRICSFAHQYR